MMPELHILEMLFGTNLESKINTKEKKKHHN